MGPGSGSGRPSNRKNWPIFNNLYGYACVFPVVYSFFILCMYVCKVYRHINRINMEDTKALHNHVCACTVYKFQ